MVVADESIVLVRGYDLAVVVHRERISVGMLLIDVVVLVTRTDLELSLLSIFIISIISHFLFCFWFPTVALITIIFVVVDGGGRRINCFS